MEIRLMCEKAPVTIDTQTEQLGNFVKNGWLIDFFISSFKGEQEIFTDHNTNYKTVLQNNVNKQTWNIHERVDEVK